MGQPGMINFYIHQLHIPTPIAYFFSRSTINTAPYTPPQDPFKPTKVGDQTLEEQSAAPLSHHIEQSQGPIKRKINRLLV